MSNRKVTAIICTLFFISLSLFFSCTGEAPDVRQLFWQLNLAYDPAIDIKYESLSVFAHVADADGIDDVDLMYIVQDKNELLWELDAEGWSKFEDGEEIWIGSNNIRMNDGSSFPRALYRLIIIDRAGERSSDEFFINADAADVSSAVFPRAVVNGEEISLDGNFREYTLWFYDEEGNQTKIFTSNEKVLPIESVLNARERQIVRSFYVNTLDPAAGYGFIYGPVAIE